MLPAPQCHIRYDIFATSLLAKDFTTNLQSPSSSSDGKPSLPERKSLLLKNGYPSSPTSIGCAMLLLFIRFLPLFLLSLSGDLFFCGDDRGCGSKVTLWATVPCLGYESCVLISNADCDSKATLWATVRCLGDESCVLVSNADGAVLSGSSRLPDCMILSLLMLLRACVIPADCFVVEKFAVPLGFA